MDARHQDEIDRRSAACSHGTLELRYTAAGVPLNEPYPGYHDHLLELAIQNLDAGMKGTPTGH